jgi:catechol 2,3-dioxygenase-like lactoylglutathione lyase family enzyme
MMDHIGLAVADFERSKSFFINALAPLDITLLMEVTAEQTGGDAHAGFGAERKPFF